MPKSRKKKTVVRKNSLLAALALLGALLLFFVSRALGSPTSDKFERIVVRLECSKSTGETILWGSGVVIGPGRLLTAAHVALGCVKEGGTLHNYHIPSLTYGIIKATEETDLALLSFKGGGEVLEFAPSAPSRLTKIWIWGFPGASDVVIVTSGIVSGYMHLTVGSPIQQLHILTDCLLTFGNSGGPAVDEDGRLVGLVSGGFRPTIMDEGYRLGMLVPIETIRKFLEGK